MLQTKALYNLLRINAREENPPKGEPWALEDLRTVPLEKLWKRLEKLDVSLQKETFLKFAEEVDSPEELAELLANEEFDPKKVDQIYLLLFELWRRLLPERPSVSIFCDEIDHQIDLYDTEEVESDEAIQDALANLADVLEEHVDAGIDSKKAFAALSDYCAHDLESFLYDYIADLLDQDNVVYASDLLELFEPFLGETEWVRLLRARLLCYSDSDEANQLVKKILSREHSLDFLVEALRFLVASGEEPIFRLAIEKIFAKVKTEEELEEVIEMIADYYRRLDADELERAILHIKKEIPRLKLKGAIHKIEEIIRR